MFGIGFGEMLVIAVVVLIAVGPDRMPTFMKAVGKGLREFRRATRELKSSVGLDELLRDDDIRRPFAQKPRPAPRPAYQLTKADHVAESPTKGVDLAHAESSPQAARAFREEPKPEPTAPLAPLAAEAGASGPTKADTDDGQANGAGPTEGEPELVGATAGVFAPRTKDSD